MKLSIVVPAYNEQDRIKPMLDAYLAFFAPKYGSDVEIVVVVNGSRDRTEDVVRDYAKTHPQVKVIVEPRPIGKGGAVLLGFEAAVGDLIGFVDADGSTPPESFQDLAERIGDAGCVISSRYLPGSVVSPKQPASRLLASRIFNTMVRVLFALDIHDTQCGAKLMKHEAVKKVLPVIGVTRWAFDVDLLFQLRRAGYRIVEAPTIWRDVSGSRVKIVRSSVEMAIALIRLRMLYSPFRWIVTIYDKTIGRFVHQGGIRG